jgi:hypothetical protein
MIMRKALSATAVAVVCIGLTGCMPKMTIEQMKADMPVKPAELKMLDAFVGKWQGTGEADFSGLDQMLKTTGESEVTWEGDGWYLVERGTYHMEELGDTQGIGIWTYDTKAKKFRTVWVDTMGGAGHGTARHDKETGTWHMKMTNHTPWGKTTAKGTVKFTDPNTMEWTYKEYAMAGLMKTMEMTGTSKRQ